MKRILLVLSVGFSVSVGAAPPPGNGPDRDSVLGGGKSYSDIFNVVAHSGPNGEAAFGHLKAQNVNGFATPFDIEADVTCLRVDGDLATIGGRLTRLDNSLGYTLDLYPGVIQYVKDGRATGTPDAISYQYPVTVIPTSCPPPSDVYTVFPLLQGNINVHDE